MFPRIEKENWESIKGIGEKAAESLADWFGDKENLAMLERMEKLGVIVSMSDTKNQTSSAKFQGLTFVLTGELSSFTRDEAKGMIRKEGGNISSSVSRKTDYVLAGKNPGSKFSKAEKLGVKIIREKEFLGLLKV